MSVEIHKVYTSTGNLSHIEYTYKGLTHRDSGPAYTTYDHFGFIKYEEYCVFGGYHRLDGPARIWYGLDYEVMDCEYWVNEKRLKKEDFENHPDVIEFNRQQEFDQFIKELVK